MKRTGVGEFTKFTSVHQGRDQSLVLVRCPDSEPQRPLQSGLPAHIAHQQPGRAGAFEGTLRVLELDQQEIRGTGPYPHHRITVAQGRAEQRPFALDECHAFMGDGAGHRLQCAQHRLDAQLRQVVGLDDPAQQRDDLGVRQHHAAACARQTIGLGERTQDHEPGMSGKVTRAAGTPANSM